MERNCLECGRSLIGRSDKKFCSDDCRTNHNNKQNSDQTNYIRRVNNILRKNRRILVKYNPQGKTKISKDKLILEGFNFQYITNIYTTKNGHTYCFVYDQGYMELGENLLMIVERQEYLDK